MAKDEITNLTSDQESSEQEDELENSNPNIIKTDITKEMQSAYLDYAMSVIVSRALPDVRDGLKPVQRRIIYAMQDKNQTESGKFHKSASVVGEVIGHYHPHGDTSVYDAMVRMAQDFSLRYPLIFPQGNFGSVDGDPPAAMRYTEAKMRKIAEELYKNIDHETVEFVINDLQNEEPVVLPSVLPNILLNGASGIAVGMATNIPPHNLNEVIDALTYMIENNETIGTGETKDETFHVAGTNFTVKVANTDFISKANVEDMMQFIKGPDFPTGGTIYNQKEITQVYATGRGRVVQRAKMDTEEMKGGKIRIVVTEIPYQVNKAQLVAKIADLVKNKKINGISDLRDESNRKGMRIVIELKKDAIVKKIQNQLYKYTPLQSTFNANMVALVHGEPKLLTLKAILQEFVKHRQIIVVKRTIFFLKKAKAREHILLGLKIAIDNIDEVIKLIRGSKDVETARTGLMTKFELTEIQAQAILDMQLRRLAALERQKIEDELAEIMKTIEGYEGLLVSPQKIIDEVKGELIDIKDRYGDERTTKVLKRDVEDIGEEDLIVKEQCIVTISRAGYIKRMKEDGYKTQGRGGKGVKGQQLKEEDIVDSIRACTTHDWGLFFTNKGKVYKLRVWEIPEASRNAKGTAIVNFLGIRQDEKVESFLVVSSETLEKGSGYVVFGTEKGNVKKTSLSDFENIRTNGIIAIRLGDDDALGWVRFSTGSDEIIMTTRMGQSIRFSEEEVRSMGRTASGVRGIKLSKKDDKVVGMVVLPDQSTKGKLLVVSDRGYGKATPITEYKMQKRGGSGILTYKVGSKNGHVVNARLLDGTVEGDILMATESGKFIRLEKDEIPSLGRATMGVKLIKLGTTDTVTSVAVLEDEAQQLEQEEKTKE